MAVVVFGVAGSGKTTVGQALAQRLELEFADADDFHTPANVAKMTAGHALSDEDRWPWLDRLAQWMKLHPASVLACSALRRSYRDRLPADSFVYLKLGPAVATSRLSTRKGHFFTADLIASQFATLEEPSPDEPILTVDAELPLSEVIDDAVAQLTS